MDRRHCSLIVFAIVARTASTAPTSLGKGAGQSRLGKPPHHPAAAQDGSFGNVDLFCRHLQIQNPDPRRTHLVVSRKG